MKKAASIFLRADIVQEDIRRLTLWLQNQRVCGSTPSEPMRW